MSSSDVDHFRSSLEKNSNFLKFDFSFFDWKLYSLARARAIAPDKAGSYPFMPALNKII
jgi:hypothetical protein